MAQLNGNLQQDIHQLEQFEAQLMPQLNNNLQQAIH